MFRRPPKPDVQRQIAWLKEKLEIVVSDQDKLNADVARLVAAESAIKAEIADLKAQVAAGVPAAALDFSGLDAVATALEGDEK